MLLELIEIQLKMDECSFLTIKYPKGAEEVTSNLSMGTLCLIPGNQQELFFGKKRLFHFGLSKSGFINASVKKSLEFRYFLEGACFKGLLEIL